MLQLLDQRLIVELPDTELEKLKNKSAYLKAMYANNGLWYDKLLVLYNVPILSSEDIPFNAYNYHTNYDTLVGASKDQQLVDAAGFGFGRVMGKLISEGANIHYNDDQALRWAIEQNHPVTVKYLVSQGTDIHAMEDEALRIASTNGNDEVVSFLIDKGAYVNAFGGGTLIRAASRGHASTVELLIRNDADIHASNDAALNVAALDGKINVLQLLLGSSFSEEALTKALSIAKSSMKPRAAALIRQHIDSGEY